MNRIQWTRGMRLTDEIMRLSDSCHDKTLAQAFMLASAGRFGLMPAKEPFRCHLNISQSTIDVDELQCLAVTRGGNIIDINYAPSYNCLYETKVQIPDGEWPDGLILTVNATDDQWILTANNDKLEQPHYSFTLIGANADVPDNALPIACVNASLKEEDPDFVPPCLYVESHSGFRILREDFYKKLVSIDEKARKAGEKGTFSMAIAIFWPLIQQLRITADMGRDLMTPAQLLSYVQRCVSAYICACAIGNIKVEEKGQFEFFVKRTYGYKDVYALISEGIKYCRKIETGIESLSTEPQQQQYQQPQQPQSRSLMAPALREDQIEQVCERPITVINISYPIPAANIFFTIDASNPTPRSMMATRNGTTFNVIFENGYDGKKQDEPDKTISLKLIAVLNGVASSISTYNLLMHKSSKFKIVQPI